MVIPSFIFARSPKVIFGAGSLAQAGNTARQMGNTILLITGGTALERSGRLGKLLTDFKKERLTWYQVSISREPTPAQIDEIVKRYRDSSIDVVFAIGGGSVLDAGKAVSAMLPFGESVIDYLEVVGKGIPHPGTKVPMIAVPTTAGTGSEATKNAVLSYVGDRGFKRSLRHDNLIPEIALIDPSLSLSCPPALTAACGMDAFTQLLESYVSEKASPMTDSLAFTALRGMADALVPACTNAEHDIGLREKLSYGSFISGIALANAGLGVVHGIAAVLGGYHSVPHGVICGTLVGPATRAAVDRLKEDGNESSLKKYAEVGSIFSSSDDFQQRVEALVQRLFQWTDELKIPRLGSYGLGRDDIVRIAAESGNKESPAKLSPSEITSVLESRI